MNTRAPGDVVAGPQAIDLNQTDQDDEPMTSETATRLRELCEKLDEPFDGNLSERQALRRIAALEEIHAGA